MPERTEFDGRIVVITGAGQGIGRGLAHAFSGAGARVVLADIDEEAGRETAFDIRKEGGQCVFLPTDISIWQDCVDLAAFAVSEFGTIDILVNNAAIARSTSGGIGDASNEAFDRVIDVNLKGTYYCAKACVPHMTRSGGGAIANIASTRAFMAEPDNEAYAASKGGILSLTRALAISLSERHIRVNCISPGWIDTSAWRKGHPPAAILTETDHRQHPAGRVGEPGDIAAACMYLCGKGAGFVTGTNLTWTAA